MIVLPIVGRELRVAARRQATRRMRILAALVAVVVLGWVMLTLFRDNIPSASHGRYLFRTLFSFAFIYCLFVGARLTSDCLSEEKREETLGLLFLTDLKGYDVVLGKLAATSLNSFYGLLAILPVLSVPVLIGGVTAAELGRSALVLLNTLFFSLSTGIAVSTVSRNERKAMFGTVFALLLGTLGPWLLAFVLAMDFPNRFGSERRLWPILALSPGFAFGWTFYSLTPFPTIFPKISFWVSAAIAHGLSWGMLLSASLTLPRIWQARGENAWRTRRRERIDAWAFGRAAARRSRRVQLLDINPFLWLVSRERWKPFYVWLYLGAIACTWLWGWWKYRSVMFDTKALVPSVLVFQTFLKIWIVSEACNRLAEDRRIGALELLLSTPLTTRNILQGQWLALSRQFTRPLAFVLVLEFLVLRQRFPTATVLIDLFMLVADAVTLGWVGMWLGLTARNLNRAILGTIYRVLVLPWAFFYAIDFGLDMVCRAYGIVFSSAHPNVAIYGWFTLGLLNNFIFGYCWAHHNLLHEFRNVATQRYESPGTAWFHPLRRRNAGPPLTPAVVAIR